MELRGEIDALLTVEAMTLVMLKHRNWASSGIGDPSAVPAPNALWYLLPPRLAQTTIPGIAQAGLSM